MNHPKAAEMRLIGQETGYVEAFPGNRPVSACKASMDQADPSLYYNTNDFTTAAASTDKPPKGKKTAEDVAHLERRRMCNRRNAKRWRVRRKTKFSHLQDQIAALQNEYKELTMVQSELRKELHREIDLVKAEKFQMSAALVAAKRQKGLHEAAQGLHGMVMRDKLCLVGGCASRPGFNPATRGVFTNMFASSWNA